MSVLVDNAAEGYEPDVDYPQPALFEVLGAVAELVVEFSEVLGVPVTRITEVRGWKQPTGQGDRIIDCRVDGQWMAFAL